MINNNIINQNKNNPIEDFNYYKGKIPAVRYDEGSYLRKKPESFPEILERLGLLDSKIRITSGHRKPGEAGNADARSNHTKLNKFGQPYAYDIVPVGMSFTDLDNLIRDNTELQQYLLNNNYRIIREDTSDAIAKYGSTGRHWHLSYRPGSTEGTAFRDYVSEYYGNKEDLQNIDVVNDLEDIEIPQLGLGTTELQHASMIDNIEQGSSNDDYSNGRPTVLLAPVEDSQISSTRKVPQEKFMDRYMKILSGVDQYINKYIPKYIEENSVDSQMPVPISKAYSNLFYSGGNTQEDQDLQRRLRAKEEAKYYNFSKKAIEDIQAGKGATVTTPEVVVIGKDLRKTKINVPAPKPILIPILSQESEDSFIPQVLQEQPKINVGQITTEDLNQKYGKYYEYPILDNVDQDMPNVYSTSSAGKESLGKDAVAKLTEGMQFDNNINLTNYIDTVPDDAIFDAISSSSNYGKQYIENIKKQNRLTSSTADKLRDYLKESSSMLPINNSINGQMYDVHSASIPSSNSVKPNLFYDGGHTVVTSFLNRPVNKFLLGGPENTNILSQYFDSAVEQVKNVGRAVKALLSDEDNTKQDKKQSDSNSSKKEYTWLESLGNKIATKTGLDFLYTDSPNKNMQAIIDHMVTNSNNNNYGIIDKRNQKLYIMNGNDTLRAEEITLGKNVGDGYNILAPTKKIYYRNLPRTTGAGIYNVKVRGRQPGYHNEQMLDLYDGKVRSSLAIHAPTKDPTRRAAFNNNNQEDNRISYGCVSGNCGIVQDIIDKRQLSESTPIFILPEMDGNYIRENNGVLETIYVNTPETYTNDSGTFKYRYNKQRYKSPTSKLMEGGPLNKFEEGGNKNPKYQAFLEDLKKYAPNLANPSSDYNMYRYWELRGKPSNWKEAQRDWNYLYNVKEDPMFTLEKDGSYHAPSTALNQDTGIVEFMKSADHPTVKHELNWYDNGDETIPNGLRIPSFEGFKSSQDFKKNYELQYSPTENKYYYIPKQR